MSVSDHPISARLAARIGKPECLLATVMGLPLVDGIFPALVLAGVLDTATGVLQVGLLVFGGSATAVVVISELDGGFARHAPSVLALGTVVLAVAMLEAALAPTIASVINVVLFERFAALVLFTIAAKTASTTIGDALPSPGTIVALGLLASVDPDGAAINLLLAPDLMFRAAASVLTATAFTLAVLALRPEITARLNIDRFRFGSAVALALVGLSVLGLLPGEAALAAFGLSIVLAYEPTGREPQRHVDADDATPHSDPTDSRRAAER